MPNPTLVRTYYNHIHIYMCIKRSTVKKFSQLKDILGIWTQLALAYAIHKSFIFIRVPMTAAVTPKVVKILRGWGWDIGGAKSKLANAAARNNTTSPKSMTKSEKGF